MSRVCTAVCHERSGGRCRRWKRRRGCGRGNERHGQHQWGRRGRSYGIVTRTSRFLVTTLHSVMASASYLNHITFSPLISASVFYSIVFTSSPVTPSTNTSFGDTHGCSNLPLPHPTHVPEPSLHAVYLLNGVLYFSIYELAGMNY